jgi:hypothetical protein
MARTEGSRATRDPVSVQPSVTMLVTRVTGKYTWSGESGSIIGRPVSILETAVRVAWRHRRAQNRRHW